MRFISSLFIFCSLLVASISGALFFLFNHTWIDLSALECYTVCKPSIVLDDEGNEWARFTLDRRKPINLAALPPHVINAFLAAEDHTFFSHPGISIRGIIRSTLVNLSRGKKVQGASTITQQLVKLLFFDLRRTYERKIKEQILSLVVEKQFSKEHILETYLNHVFFGCGIYGIEAASQRFWGKHACELTYAQAATLAGILRSPTRYCPLNSPHDSLKRRNVILGVMYKLKYITENDYTKSLNEPLNLIVEDHNTVAHAKEMVRLFIEEHIGRQELYTGGLIIQTTLNKKIQETAYHTFNSHIKKLRTIYHPQTDGGLVALDPQTGGIKALIGGYNFTLSQFNRATQARRQMGSTIKPLIYAQALQQGTSLTSTEIDAPLTLTFDQQEWSPQNSTKRFEGLMTRAYALAHSNNIVTIKTLLDTGIQPVITLARSCGLTGYLPPYPSLALGTANCSVLEVAGMFNIFVNKGTYVEPHLISWVKDESGNKIWKHTTHQKNVLSWSIASQMNKVLTLTVDRFKKYFTWLDADSIGKTGTTNDARTCWYTGATPTLTTALYIGCDNNEPLGKHVYAINATLPLWLNFNRALTHPQKKFSYDPHLTEVTIHALTGELLHTDDSDEHAIQLLVEPKKEEPRSFLAWY